MKNIPQENSKSRKNIFSNGILKIIIYIKYTIKHYWKKYYTLISKNINCDYILNDRYRWPEAEKYIIMDSFQSYYYSREILKRRWPKAEEVIMQDPWIAYYYAKEVINGRWPEAEYNISKNKILAYNYAINIIKGKYDFDQYFVSNRNNYVELYIGSFYE